MKGERSNRTSERGAMLVHVAVALLGLMAISAFAIDFGVFYVSRRQAQNSADAGALAGAIALAYDDANDLSDDGPAKQSAFALSQVNQVWGEPPNVDPPTDITFPVCPDGTSPCVRVDVYRNAARGNALPILFGGLAGIDSQGVRATATAQATASNASACMKPWIIPDMWAEHYPVDPGTWNANTSTFDTHTGNGNNRVELQNPDQYRPPTDSNMTGFRRTGTPNHIGMELTLKAPQPSQQNGGGAVQPGWVYPVRLDEDAPGGNEYMNDILHCSGKVVRIGDWLRNETGIMIGPTMHGVDPLILEDEGATWVDPDGPGGDEGWITGSCMNTASCTGPYAPSPTISPRVFVIPVFNTATFSYSSGAEWLQVVNILGFFLQERTNNEIRGVLIPYQGMYAQGGGAVDEGAAFSYTVRLVR